LMETSPCLTHRSGEYGSHLSVSDRKSRRSFSPRPSRPQSNSCGTTPLSRL
jgi:hypothetical protein